ncbi:FAD-binding protein [Arthrobacter gengyunqii]|uniref:FAD-binding protein n=1 Tax=Arthrobacter gengyunqii TaxID=2886940 RepID=A0A9X1M124_9MICC|nr:FAD-binding protein [Arthrobacter gengyunqii]MCC3268985.1 FAD-binding protein [Arthrobacter gengyunqii]UOY96362.1 FAD-binding protein [Arthrobacter gengyunqii]
MVETAARRVNGTANTVLPEAGIHTEVTTAVVIGSGLTGLAVVSELNRRGVESVVLDGLQHDSQPVHVPVPDAAGLPERAELLRLLHGYATGHSLDIRRGTAVQAVGLLRGSKIPAPVTRAAVKWAVHTPGGLLLADAVVLAGCGRPAVLKLLRSLGFTAGTERRRALRSAGLYLVGAGEAVTSPTRELVRQAKRAGQEVAQRGAAFDSGSGVRAGSA